MNSLPVIKSFSFNTIPFMPQSAIILSEGFEDRSLHWIRSIPDQKLFEIAVVCKYHPEKKSRLGELLPLVQTRTIAEPVISVFYRYEPQQFEIDINKIITEFIVKGIEEIIIDISVMSKLMILIILCVLKDYTGRLRIIYSEPIEYAPKKPEYLNLKNKIGFHYKLPSYGVHDVVRTSMLSSTVMQRRPNIVIAFTSFNEQLIRALLSVINPTHIFLINGVPPHLLWREKAMQEIFSGIINDYSTDNPTGDDGQLKRRTSTLLYTETFTLIAEIYRKYCYSYRIIVAPTGSKMQAVGCGILKICCPDIHIEYPTPESFFFQGYSSPEIRDIHEVLFDEYAKNLRSIAEENGLNG